MRRVASGARKRRTAKGESSFRARPIHSPSLIAGCSFAAVRLVQTVLSSAMNLLAYNDDMAVTLIGIAALGVGIGILSGLLGVGGGTIMVPLFRLVLGMSPVGATATSLFTIIPTSLSGAVSHLRNKTCLLKLGIAMGVGGACTSSAGAWLAHGAPGWTIMVASAVAIAYSSITMLRKALAIPKSDAQASAAYKSKLEEQVPNTLDEEKAAHNDKIKPISSAAVLASETRTVPIGAKQLFQGVGIGVVTGFVSGFIGLGGGFIMVPLMLSFFKLPMKVASGTSLCAIILLALPATVLQCWYGNVDYLVGIGIACGSIPGAVIGAKLANRVPERALRFVFAGFLGIAAVLLVLRETGLFG